MRHRDIELQNTIELRATAWEIATKISLRMWPTRISLRTWQQNVTPIMQPLQQSATRDSTSEKNYAQMNNHSLAEQLRAERPQPERPQPQPPHTGGTFHRRLQPLYTEKHKVSCSGFPPTSAMQHSCSHHNAFCSMTWLTRMYLRTWQHEMTTIVQPFQ